MKAQVLHAIGDLRLEEVPTPMPREGEVLLRVGACGVCGSDIPRIFSKGTYRFPTIPGHEFAGTVVAAGKGVSGLLVGSRAAVFPLIPCRQCGPCSIGAFAQCENYDYLGSRSDGAFAEHVRVPAWNLLPLPPDLSLEEAACVEPAAVAAHALRRAQVDLGDSVLIFGAGPIGLLVALWAQLWGAAKVLVVDVDVERLRFARKIGFLHLFDARGDVGDWVRKKTERGADIVVEASGSAPALENCMRCVRTFGKVVLLGNPAGGMALSQDSYWAILRKELTVVGSWNSVYNDTPRNEWKLAIDAMASGKLDVKRLITHRTTLDGLWDHLLMMRDRSPFSNKVMLIGEE
ncbi:MAG: galactitol-1-phosphate 5-dehydrogenase [Candidatus Hydrogenedentes bacterium]|nr:galactitol-1-phosphate 5-dehydrogenase [Candidatus Hydrogenedentota bacterium]